MNIQPHIITDDVSLEEPVLKGPPTPTNWNYFYKQYGITPHESEQSSFKTVPSSGSVDVLWEQDKEYIDPREEERERKRKELISRVNNELKSSQ